MTRNATGRKPNRLINEKSPYLLQHAYNPVDWYPWGVEAFEKAKAENKPVFLSIGYSTCHWCHVMERESFEDGEVAGVLNRGFVSIKVDREERPDLDHIYMTACQALTGHGGWPLTAILTPHKHPFFAGTYFPKKSRHGLPGIMELLSKLLTLWEKNEDRARQAGIELFRIIREQNLSVPGDSLPGEELLERAYRDLKDSYDPRYGGFGRAPKFPVPHQLTFLLGYWKRTGETPALEMAVNTLRAMARGGIFDHLGYGFHRYSTDQRWLVPHFEKMLYDQALLALAYLEAYQAAGEEEFAEAARRVLEYVERDLITPEGAVCAAEDADTHGEEGLFYVWSRDEIMQALGKERGNLAAGYYGVTEEGNFENGTNVLHRSRELSEIAAEEGMDLAGAEEIMEQCRRQLFDIRSRRERPFRDDKVITGWNGLMIAAFARGAAILAEPRYNRAAESIALFIKKRLTGPGGRLLRSYRDGVHSAGAFLDDFVYFIWGLMELYRSTFRVGYLEWAVSLNQSMLELFKGDGGALNYSGNDEVENLPDYRDAYDGATPSGNSVAALNLLKLGRLTGSAELEEKGEEIIKSFGTALGRSPTNFTFMLSALDFALGPVEEVVISGKTGSPEVEAMIEKARASYNPRRVLLFHPGENGMENIEKLSPFIKPMIPLHGQTTAYVCRNRSCLPPVTSPEKLARLLEHENVFPGSNQ